MFSLWECINVFICEFLDWEDVFLCVYMYEHVSLHPCCAWVRMLGEYWCMNVWIVYWCEYLCKEV